jgi:hypothetical protein
VGWNLKFSAWFMKKIIGTGRDYIMNKYHFVENKTHYEACLQEAVNFPVA